MTASHRKRERKSVSSDNRLHEPGIYPFTERLTDDSPVTRQTREQVRQISLCFGNQVENTHGDGHQLRAAKIESNK